MGRVYLPQTRWRGLSLEQFGAQQPNETLQSILREWVQYARAFFERGQPLIGLVPKWLATDVELFARGGLAILQAIEDAEFDVWTRRPTVSKWSKFKLLVKACVHRRGQRGGARG